LAKLLRNAMATASIPATASSRARRSTLLVQIVSRKSRAVGEGTTRHAEAELARHEGTRHLQLQVVEVVAMLAADLE
jgi:hypothetical protein